MSAKGAGRTIGGRFELVTRAAAGGMGEVWQARDLITGGEVALKLILRADALLGARLEREGAALSRITHPNVVRYLDSGVDPTSGPWLAMQWLPGLSLARRLAQGRIPLTDAVAIARRLADALAALHAGGLIHRDLKPANVILRGPRDPCLVDFGLVRSTADTSGALTQAGMVIGTPRYMSPEQVRGVPPADARADLWALGVVTYELVCGSPAIEGPDALAVMAKVLLEPIGRLSERVRDVPRALDDLVAGLVEREVTARTRSAELVLEALDRVMLREGAAMTAPAPRGVASSVRRLAALLVVAAPERATVDEAQALATIAAEIATRRKLRVERVREAALLITTHGRRPVQEQALVAARCALALRAALPQARLALALSRTSTSGTESASGLGAAIDRAAGLLARPDAAGGPVPVDEPMARLLAGRLHVEAGIHGPAVSGRSLPAAPGGATRPIRGRLQGREAEIGELHREASDAILGGGARALVMLGEPGVGKTRLREELLDRLARDRPELKVWHASADPSRDGAPWALSGDLVRNGFDLDRAEDRGRADATLALGLATCIPPAELARVATFLGEITGIGGSEVPLELRAARSDFALLGDQVRRALLDLIDGSTRKRGGSRGDRPLVLVVDDVQWGDRSSIEWLARGLELFGDRPWLVLASGRPEAAERTARLAATPRGRTLWLKELGDDAIASIAAHALGPKHDPRVVARVVAQAGGNPLFAEEIVREVLAGRGDALPASVLALAEQRLEALEPPASRLLRAASVMGQVFWRDAMTALVPDEPPAATDERLAALVAQGWIAPMPVTRFRGEQELVFRHGALRDAAYAQTLEEDRTKAHGIAARWLEERGEPDAAVVANHLSLAGEEEEAASRYARAAEQAIAAGDFASAIARGGRAVASASSPLDRGRAAIAVAEAHRWRGEYPDALAAAERALIDLEPGTERWFAAAGERVVAASRMRKLDELVATASALEATTGRGPPSSAQVVAVSRAAMLLLHANVARRAGPLYAWLETVLPSIEHEPAAASRAAFAFAWRAHASGDWEEYRRLLGIAASASDRAGDLRTACQLRANGGHACVELGAYQEACALLESALAIAERMALEPIAALCRNNLGIALAGAGRLTEGIEMERAAVASYERAKDGRLEAASRVYLASLLANAGDLDEAEREAGRAAVLAQASPVLLPHALAVQADVQRRRGDVATAREVAARALAAMESVGRVEGDATLVHLAAAEAELAGGDRDRALEHAIAGRKVLVTTAARIRDPALREAYLGSPAHRRILELTTGALEPVS